MSEQVGSEAHSEVVRCDFLHGSRHCRFRPGRNANQVWGRLRQQPHSLTRNAIRVLYAKLATALFLKALRQVDSTVGDVVQLVRTLPCRWLESRTVTANSLTCSTKRTIPSLSPPSRGKPADAAPDGQPLTAASLRECSGYLRRGPVRPKQLSTEHGKTRR